jgi:uncharacterized membrane protein YeaQ/YmgE (transglycosylase-associated protein family)
MTVYGCFPFCILCEPGRSGIEDAMGIIWTIIIGFVAGLIAKFLHSGPNEPSGFILATVLGIVGAMNAGHRMVPSWRRCRISRGDHRRNYSAGDLGVLCTPHWTKRLTEFFRTWPLTTKGG